MDEEIKDEKFLLNLLEQQRKILEFNVERKEVNYHQDAILSISEEMDDIVISYYRQKMKKYKKNKKISD